MWLYLIGGAGLIFLIFKAISKGTNYSSGMYKPSICLDLEEGKVMNVEVNIMNPENDIQYDETTEKPYLNRQFGFLQSGDKKIWLENFWRRDFAGWRIYLNNIDVLNKELVWKLKQTLELVNKHENIMASQKAENLQLITKADEEQNKRVEQAKKSVVIPFVKMPKVGMGGGKI